MSIRCTTDDLNAATNSNLETNDYAAGEQAEISEFDFEGLKSSKGKVE